MNLITPTHKHDCDECEFIGSLKTSREVYDFYKCASTETARDSWILRWGSDPHENASCPTLALDPVSTPGAHMLMLAAVKLMYKATGGRLREIPGLEGKSDSELAEFAFPFVMP